MPPDDEPTVPTGGILEAATSSADPHAWGPTVSVSQPDDVVIHPVLHQDIMAALSAGENPAHDWALALGFGGLGLCQNIIYVIGHMWNGTPAPRTDTLLALISAGCIAGGVAKYTEYRRTKKGTDSVKQRLENRLKRPVTTYRAGGPS